MDTMDIEGIIIKGIVIIAIILVLFGVITQDKKEVQGLKQEIFIDGGMIAIYTDKETGVEYLLYQDSNKGGICVRVDADGKPIVNKE